MYRNFTLTIIIGLLVFPLIGFSQIGGTHIYEFLSLSQSARNTALGGAVIAVQDDDLALGFANPAVLNPRMHQQITFNHNLFLAGIQHGYVAYGHHIDKYNLSVHGGLQYITYGDFNATDEFGNINGEFNAAEYAFTFGGGYQLYDRMRLGANLKVISSQFESYNSYGISADFGAYYQDTTGRFSMALVFRNAGYQLSTYNENNREDLPFDLQFSIAQRLKHLPFRLMITAHNLQRWNIRYDDPNAEQATILFQEPVEESQASIIVDNIFRHLIFSGEFMFGKKENLRIRFSYNHLKRRELSVSSAPRSLAGFGLGFGLKINRFRIEYGRGVYHLAGGANHLSISTSLAEFKKKGRR